MSSKALAHVRDSDGKKQTLEDHLKAVGELTAQFAKVLGLEKSGLVAGEYHDRGKDTDAFQRYLLSSAGQIDPDSDDFVDPIHAKGRIDHSTAGARFVYEILYDRRAPDFAQMMFLAICSHHSGLIDCISPEGDLVFDRRLQKSDDKTHYNECVSRLDEALKSRVDALKKEVLEEWQDARRRIRETEGLFYKNLPVATDGDLAHHMENTQQFKIGLLLRMFFSCLIDADRTDTISFADDQYAILRKDLSRPEWQKLSERLEAHLATFSGEGKINTIRADISRQCLERASDKKGIYSLTVPTGGGKTLSSLRYAINHAKVHQMDRIIVVIPYTSILEQNAAVARKILECPEEKGTVVLEHHSNIQSKNETWQGKLLSENWDAPVVYTTMVQFLEALFGSGTSSVRRMHCLANSVLVFDEIQTLPIRCVHMYCHAINYLVEHCGSTALMCTATQPLLDRVPAPEQGGLRMSANPELMSDVSFLFDGLRRVNVIDHTADNDFDTLEQVASLAREEYETGKSVLVVVNTKRVAASLYDNLKNSITVDNNLYHLSTSMCAEHRTDILDGQIKPLLARCEPVILISTQLIECGVDISFQTVIRMAAGLDSILQSAGRCNRNAENDTGTLHIVRLREGQENVSTLPDIVSGRRAMLRVLDEYRNRISSGIMDITDPEIIKSYFSYYFYDRKEEMAYPVEVGGARRTLVDLLGSNTMAPIDTGKRILRQSFATASSLFASIDAETQGIVVPYKKGKEIIANLCSLNGVDKATLARKRKLVKAAQRYSVNLYPEAIKKLDGAIHTIGDTGIRYLDETHYDSEMGIVSTGTGKMDFLYF